MKYLSRSSLMAGVLGLSVSLAAGSAMAEKVIKLSHLNPGDPYKSHSGAMASVFKSLVEAAIH